MADLEALARIAAITEERALARLRDVLSDEQRLQCELDQIETLRKSAVQDIEQAHARRISGAETQWQGWLIQRRLALNHELIQLRIKKAERQDRATYMHARASVTQSLARTQSEATERSRRRSEDEALRQLALLRGSGKG